MEAIIAQNVLDVPQQHWVFVALPPSHQPDTDAGWLLDYNGNYHPFIKTEHGIHALLSLPAKSKRTLKISPRDLKAQPFAWHPAISNDLGAVAPSMWYGGIPLPGPSFTLESDSPAHQVWRLEWRLQEQKITVTMWATVYTQSPTIEWTTHAVYGTTANDNQPQVREMHAELKMTCPAQLCRDFALRNGQTNAHRAPGASGWSLTLVPIGKWHRGVRHESRGAIMPIADPARVLGMPMKAVYTGWDGNWLALGKVPSRTPELTTLRHQQFQQYVNPTFGNYSDPRPRCQPRESGTTGDQADFGCASDLAVTTWDPWEIHDALWQCQSYVQRPTSNKEFDGQPMRAEQHPQAVLHNQRPDLSYGPNDRLGWPGINQIQWIPSPNTTLWTTSDDQHRSDNFLHATYLLTRDPALASVIEDHIQLDKLDVYVKNDWVPAPRAVGRMALTRANQYWLGFEQVKPVMLRQIELALTQTPYGYLPATCKVRTIGGRDQAKYGWLGADNFPIIGWQPWQETIAAIGILAAGRVCNDDNLIRAARVLAETVVDEAFRFDASNRLHHAYAIRWNDGFPMQTSQWPTMPKFGGESSNYNVYISSACQAWTMAAAHIVSDTSSVAAGVVASDPLPRNMQEGRWRAL
jgi:hypothetical protein